jgi:uncharacterized membrane protein YebE (DUF533 family)
MDAQNLIHSLLEGALAGRRKRGTRALRALTDSRNPLLNPATLLTLGGLAWGVYEAATAKPGGFAGPGAPSAPPPLPPLPKPGGAGAAAATPPPEGLLRLLRLTISAARADGALHDAERAAILRHARAAGAEALVEAELRSPRTLGEIVAGVSEENQKRDLYVLAFTIVRADESVSGAERIYLAQLAHALGLAADEVKALEQRAAARIDAQDEGE